MLATTALSLVLAAAGLAAGGWAAALRPGRVAAVQAAAGGLLLALAAGDLLPDSVRDGRESGLAVAVVVAVFAAAFALAGATLARGHVDDGCCAVRAGRFAAGALIGHGLAEGALVGLGSGLAPDAGPWLVVAFCLHKVGEGFALTAGVAAGSRRRVRVAGWLAMAALAPVAGAILAERFPVTGVALPAMTAALAGALAAIALRLIHPAAELRTPVVRAMALLGVTVMAAVIGLGG